MKIVLTGGGTGGHFYPLLAITERVYEECDKESFIYPDIYYYSDTPYNEKELNNLKIKFEAIPAGKLRLGFDLRNILDIFKTLFGIFVAFVKLLQLYPDIVIGKGGYASFPTLFAAILLRIPILIHDSDTVPGRVNQIIGKFADRIALSYQEAAIYFPGRPVAYTGQPLMKKITPPENFVREYSNYRKNILILGGSQGSQSINDKILEILPEILNDYNIIHQTGNNNLEEVKKISESLTRNHSYRDKYYLQSFLDLSKIYPSVDICITRAGSTLLELAAWQIPAIVIPIPQNISRDQHTNAYTFARLNAGIVIEQNNLSGAILINEINRICKNKDEYMRLVKGAREIGHIDGASIIAKEVLKIIKTHYE